MVRSLLSSLATISVKLYTQNGVKPDFSQMTNYAFQGVGRTLNLIAALAIHHIKCAAKANCRLDLVPQPKGVGLSFLGFYPVSCIIILGVKKSIKQAQSSQSPLV